MRFVHRSDIARPRFPPSFCTITRHCFQSKGFWRYTAYALALVAVVLLIQEWFQCWITEIAVTNRRIIYKKGLIRRQTNEMNMDKVESVKINQSILGRMLDYGDVTILGTGEGFETLCTIASPIELRNSVITGTAQKA